MAEGIGTSRAFADAVFDRFRGPDRDVVPPRIEGLGLPGGKGARPARLYHPGGDGPVPVILFLHGGGWSLGGLDSYAGFAMSIAALSGCAVAGLHYPLAAARHRLDHAGMFGGDRTRVAVMGDSAGGNLAAVVARELALAGDTRLKGQILVYPMTDVVSPDDRFASRTLYGQGQHFLANAGIAFARDTYLAGSDARPGDPRISLLDAPVPAGIAAAFILTAGHDPLRDEAAAYHAQLERAGVASRYHCAGSTIHAFASFGVLDVAQDARRMLADAAREMLTKG
jgi:acetyl esterase